MKHRSEVSPRHAANPVPTALGIGFVVIAALAAAAALPAFGCQSLGATGTSADGGASPSGTSGGTGTSGGVGDGGAADGQTGPATVISPSGVIQVETYAGSATDGINEGVGGAAQFNNPVGVAIAPDGDLYVTEYEGRRIRKLTPDRQSSLVYAGLNDPFGIIVVGANTIYVQTDQNQINQKNDTSGTIWKLAGGAPEVVVTGLGRPRGIVQLADGRVALADMQRHTVVILDLATKAVTPLAGKQGVTGLVDALGDSARFSQPYGCSLLPDGSIVLADYGNNVIRRVTIDGDVSTFAGDGVAGMKDDPNKLQARFNGPQDVSADELGNVFVSDTNNYRIRRITTEGGVETIAGNGIQGYADGTGTEAEFYGQEQLETTADGKTLFVSDGNRGVLGMPFNRVRQVTLP